MNPRLGLALALGVLSSGCVIRYGTQAERYAPKAEQRERVDLTPIETHLLELRETAATSDVDRRDRIDAYLELVRVARRLDPEAQVEVAAYLERIIGVESRWEAGEGLEIIPAEGWTSPISGDLGVEVLESAAIIAPIDSVELADEPEPVTPTRDDTAAVLVASEDLEDVVRDSLARSDYQGAIALLEGEAVYEEPLQSLWMEAVDGYVQIERERAGSLFMAARSEPDSLKRLEELSLVLEVLVHLSVTYPDSTYTKGIGQNIRMVERVLQETEAMREVDGKPGQD